jgi:hypothetical protein
MMIMYHHHHHHYHHHHDHHHHHHQALQKDDYVIYKGKLHFVHGVHACGITPEDWSQAKVTLKADPAWAKGVIFTPVTAAVAVQARRAFTSQAALAEIERQEAFAKRNDTEVSVYVVAHTIL